MPNGRGVYEVLLSGLSETAKAVERISLSYQCVKGFRHRIREPLASVISMT